jgi:predicted membrane protein
MKQARHERGLHMKFEHERNQSFTSTGEVHADVSTRSGDVSVDTHAGREILVTLGAQSGSHQHLLDEADITFDAEKNVLRVRSQTNNGFESLMNLKDLLKKKTWTDEFNHGVNVHITLPRGSSVEIASASGDIDIEGDVTHVKAITASGDVVVGTDVASLDVKSTSGDVRTGPVRERLECQSASGDVQCSGAASTTIIRTASGDVAVEASIAAVISVRAVSGDVRIAVARGLAVDVKGASVSGEMASSIALDAEGDGASASETVTIDVTTVSGDVHVDRVS